MAIKNALRLRAKKTFASAGLQTLYSERVEQSFIYCFQQVSWEIDKATAGGNTRCRLYIGGRGYKLNLDEQDGPTANQLYTYNEHVWLIAGERLALDIDEGQASTTAEMNIAGYYTESKEGIT